MGRIAYTQRFELIEFGRTSNYIGPPGQVTLCSQHGELLESARDSFVDFVG